MMKTTPQKPVAGLLLAIRLTSILIAGLAVAAGAAAFAAPASAAPAPSGTMTVSATAWPDALERRIDKALAGLDISPVRKLRIVEILEVALPNQALRERHTGIDRAMSEAMAAPTVDSVRIEQLRQARMALIDAQSRRVTWALKDAAGTLDADQRAAFFRNWNERPVEQASRSVAPDRRGRGVRRLR